MNSNFAKYILDHNGTIKPLKLLGNTDTEGLGPCNPSVFIDNGRILCSIRYVNYALHLSLSNYWNSAYGPTNYHHPDDDVNLRTENYICELDTDLDIIPESVKHVKYKPYSPQWNFVGEEDIRIVRWDGKLYVTGCRRDTESTGISRMELSELDNDMNEVGRTRIPSPGGDKTYCEKNWMAILDKPYQYVKWCNPVEVVEYDPKSKTTKTLLVKRQDIASEDELCDLRGSSQVVKVDDYYVAIVHEVNLWKNRYAERMAKYFTRFIVFDGDFNVIKLSQRFHFMNFPIEFTNGLAYDGHDFIIPFSVSDNAAFISRLSKTALFRFIGLSNDTTGIVRPDLSTSIAKYVYDINNPYAAYHVGLDYFNEKQYISAFAFFMQSAELAAMDKRKYKTIGYDAFYLSQKCLEFIKGRQGKLVPQYNMLIDWDAERYEAYHELSRQNYGAENHKNDHNAALGYAKLALERLDSANTLTGIDTDKKYLADRVKMQYAICCYRCSKDYEAVPMLKDLISNGHPLVRKQILALNLNL